MLNNLKNWVKGWFNITSSDYLFFLYLESLYRPKVNNELARYQFYSNYNRILKKRILLAERRYYVYLEELIREYKFKNYDKIIQVQPGDEGSGS